MLEKNEPAGFDAKRIPYDKSFARTLVQYGLNIEASLAEAEPFATELLNSPSTLLKGLELVFNRPINSTKDIELIKTIFVGGTTGEQRFGLALLGLVAEQERKRQEQIINDYFRD